MVFPFIRAGRVVGGVDADQSWSRATFDALRSMKTPPALNPSMARALTCVPEAAISSPIPEPPA